MPPNLIPSTTTDSPPYKKPSDKMRDLAGRAEPSHGAVRNHRVDSGHAETSNHVGVDGPWATQFTAAADYRLSPQ